MRYLKKFGILFMFLLVSLAIVTVTVVTLTMEDETKDNGLTKMSYEYTDKPYDNEGNLKVPYDIAFKKAFDDGTVLYNKEHVLLKFSNDFNGELTRNLKTCGIVSLTKSLKTETYTWYKAKIGDDQNIVEVVEKLRQLDEIICVDYDYVVKTASIIDAEGVSEAVVHNPGVGNQWHLKTSNIQKMWKELKKDGISEGGDSSVVVAVIDTGVDYNHEDLNTSMWVNRGETPNNGIDDDNNGVIDDVHGASFISDDRFTNGDPMDDHGHGTHVAGIIGAANNKKGVVGIAYNTKIMAIKAGNASGYFNQSDIAEAVIYAYENGADVINMSFGGGAISIEAMDALQKAYTRCVLVAAAGNNGYPNELAKYYPPAPSYPAALSYVLGVMSVGRGGVESSFSNWDVYLYNNSEYEIYAPGEEILSTLPNNQYAAWSGTSMAAPVVSGIVALLRSKYIDRDMYPTKFIYGQIVSTSETPTICFNPNDHLTPDGRLHNIPNIVDGYAAYTKIPKPDVNLSDYYVFDAVEYSEANNGDGVIDAGETIYLTPVLRNRWGMSKNTMIYFDATSIGGVDNPYITFEKDYIDFGEVGTYSTKDLLNRDGSIITGADRENSIVIKVSKDCPNDYLLTLNFYLTYENALDENDHNLYQTKPSSLRVSIRNGIMLPNIISKDMTLTKDNYYIIPNSMTIKEGATVTVEAGTKIQFWSDDPLSPYHDTAITYLKVDGKFICLGEEDEQVELFPSELFSQFEVRIYESGNGVVELYNKRTVKY